ncbi:MAG: hypothetical protein WAK85_12630, partial [Xanthobacteraceae bacterium]
MQQKFFVRIGVAFAQTGCQSVGNRAIVGFLTGAGQYAGRADERASSGLSSADHFRRGGSRNRA